MLSSSPHHELEDRQTSGVSGASVFWALMSLALSTMLQPSFCGHVLSNADSFPALTLCRSSPFVCLADTAVDFMIVTRSLRGKNPQPQNDSRAHQLQESRLRYFVQLALLLLGVLPPTIKVFSASGIPYSQVLGAIFTSSAVASAVRTLLSGEPAQPLNEFVDSWYARNRTSSGDAGTALLLVLVVWPHNIFLMLVWAEISERVHLSIPKDISVLIVSLGNHLALGLLAYCIQHTFFVVARGHWMAPRLPIVLGLASVFLLGFICELAKPANSKQVETSVIGKMGAGMMVVWHIWLCSLILASVLKCLLSRVLIKFVSTARSGTQNTDMDRCHLCGTASSTVFQSSHAGCVQHTGSQDQSESPADGDIGLATLHDYPVRATTESDMQSNSPEASATALQVTTQRHRLKTEAEAKGDVYVASRIIHAITFPETEDPIEWEKRMTKLVEEGRTPYIETTNPPPGVWEGLFLNFLWYLMIFILRLGVGVQSIFNYIEAWISVKFWSWRQAAGWLAFVILNITTAVTFYFVGYRIEGTKSANWAELLG